MPARQDHAQVSWKDVEQAMRAVGATHCCDVKVEVSYPVREDTPVLFWVRVTAYPRIVGRKTIRHAVAVGHRWPHADHATMPGLMLRLVYKLDHDLDEVGHCPAEQATFPWDEA